MGNAYSWEAAVLRALPERLSQLLPPTWTVTVINGGHKPNEGTLRLAGPGGSPGGALLLDVAVRRWAAAPSAQVAGVLASTQRVADNPLLLVTDYTNRPLRTACERLGISYLDDNGWAYLRNDDPAVYIKTIGKERRTPRIRNEVTRLDGVAAGRIIRTLLTMHPPIGVRDLQESAGVASAGSVSKLLPTLAAFDAVERDNSGRVTDINRRALLSRWTQDYSLRRGNRLVDLLSPRGLDPVIERLRDRSDIAVTGLVAGASYLRDGTVPLVPATRLVVYAPRARVLGDELGLSPTDQASSNIIISEPRDEQLITSAEADATGLARAPLPQVLADLVTLPGRESLLADQLMDQLAESDPLWRQP